MVDGNIEQIVKEILAQQLNITTDRITLESRLMEDLGLDSFGSVEVAFALEEKFGLKISDEAIYTAKTVKDIVDYLTNQTSKK
ncbi:MAG: acyl carrier protein [Candidatus Omnitrophica bacterium]|nr:acyl carrier protein [Candidatus Omnitrophota bacterium]